MQHTFIPFALALSLGACTAGNGDEAILITKNVVAGDACSFSSAASEAGLLHGTINVHSPNGYRLHPQMLSRIEAREGFEDQRTILTKGAHVDITFADPALANVGGGALTKFDSLFSAPLLPNGGVTDGAFEAIPAALLDAIATAKGTASFRTELIVKATVFGEMAGDEVTSNEFQFPVTVCSDCVVNVLVDANNVALACPVMMETLNKGNACNVFQDGLVDCCTRSGALVCPAPVMLP